MKKLFILIVSIFLLASCNTNTKIEKNNIQKNTNIQNQTTKKSDVQVFAITDKTCGYKCDVTPIIAGLKKQIPELVNKNIKVFDYSSDEAKKLMEKSGIKKLPAIIFSNNGIETIKKYLIKTKDNKYSLNIWASFDPTRTETPKTLDVFTMWYCPFGEIALKALPEIQKTFKDDWVKINIHYIANKVKDWDKADSFQSLHWVPEAEEDIRQICINKNYWFDKLIAYAQERYKNADNYGRITDKPEDNMKAVWIDSKKINKCIESWEGAKLLEKDIKIAQELGIWASPTWFANNKFQFGGIKAQNIQAQFCEHNPDLKGCKTKIEETTQTTWNNPSCGK